MNTTDNVSNLPELLRRHQVMRITGLSRGKYQAFIESNPTIVVHINGISDVRVSKRRLMELITPRPAHSGP